MKAEYVKCDSSNPDFMDPDGNPIEITGGHENGSNKLF